MWLRQELPVQRIRMVGFIFNLGNIEHRTSNIQRPTSNGRAFQTLDVGCFIGSFHARSYQPRDWLQILQTDSITGTSTSTPTTVASAAPEPAPNSVMATATASSKKLLAPMSAPGAATLYGTRSLRINR